MTGHFTTSIEFQMSLLLFVSLAGYLLATRIHQSAVIGEILVGLIIGPSMLGWITYTNFVQSVAHLGAIILLFVVGLEFKIRDIFNIRYGIIALVGVIIPWIGGYLVTTAFGFSQENAIFTGTALTATSIAITANVLREMGQLQTEAAKAIIGAAVIDDVLSLLALSFSEQMVTGDFSFASVGFPVLKAGGFIVAAIYFGTHLCRFVERLDRTSISQKFPEFVFIFVMMIAFLYAMFAEMLGLSSIVGAFIAGISLEGAVIRNGKDYKHGAEYLHIIFASIFFVSLGILVDTHVLTSQVILFLISLTVVAILTKVIGCFIPARMQGMSFRDSAVIGFGMSPRGEVAMIVGLIGLNQKLITQEIYAAIIFMSLITTIVTPLVLRQWFYPAQK
ncbi:MAG: cation:proton antiporter [Candidatus Omnitrophica bacterium]|nr:cation:proton antiporter [Candidatus Omnitrophota bacterium]